MLIYLLLLQLPLQPAAQTGLASVYYPTTEIACKNKHYDKRLPICANRELACGTVLNVQREDTGKIAQCRVLDRGPFGICLDSKNGKGSRACGEGKKWKNGNVWYRKNLEVDDDLWRGIIDLSPGIANKLGVHNRLIKVNIWREINN